MQGKLRPQCPLRAAITVLQPETQIERVGIRAVYSVQRRYQTVKFPVGGCGKCHLQFGIRADGGSQVFQFHIPQGQVYPHAAGGQYLHIGGGFGGSIDNCTASGTVKATGNEPVGLGGIGGCLEMMDTITNCTADVTIESENGGHAIGGLCGYAGTHSNPDVCLETEGFSTKNYPSVIDNCNVTVNIKANGATHVGGLVGTGLYYYGEETVFKITNCSVKGSIDGAVTPGTVAGRAEGSTIESCTADVTIDGNAGTEQVGTTTQMYESADQ